jgi:hypothetical protein
MCLQHSFWLLLLLLLLLLYNAVGCRQMQLLASYLQYVAVLLPKRLQACSCSECVVHERCKQLAGPAAGEHAGEQKV